MGLRDFLSKRDISNDTKEVFVNGIDEPFVIKAISQGEDKAIRKVYTKTYTEKKTGQRISDLDVNAYNAALVAACCVEPNFKDAGWQKELGVMGEISLIEKVLKNGEYTELVLRVQEHCGFDININDEIETAKN